MAELMQQVAAGVLKPLVKSYPLRCATQRKTTQHNAAHEPPSLLSASDASCRLALRASGVVRAATAGSIVLRSKTSWGAAWSGRSC